MGLNWRVAEAGRGYLVDLRDRWMFSDALPPLHGRWRVKSAPADQQNSPFFVLGHPRSGTTLLRAMISRHPDVFIPPENGGLWRMIRVFGGLRRAPWDEVVDAVVAEFVAGYEFQMWQLDPDDLRTRALAVPQAERTLDRLISLFYTRYGAIHAPGKSLWGDKTTPGSFRFLNKLVLVFPDARYLHIVRDGRDCVASAMKAGFFNRDPVLAAIAWRDNVRICRRLGDELGSSSQYLEVRYEKLVQDPASYIGSFCAFLGVENSSAMRGDNGSDEVVDRLPDVGQIAHHKNVTRPVFKDSVGKWKQSLSDDEIRAITGIMAPELRRFGYPVDQEG